MDSASCSHSRHTFGQGTHCLSFYSAGRQGLRGRGSGAVQLKLQYSQQGREQACMLAEERAVLVHDALVQIVGVECTGACGYCKHGKSCKGVPQQQRCARPASADGCSLAQLECHA